MGEVVVVADLLAGKDISADALGIGTFEIQLHFLCLVKTGVGERNNDASVFLLGSRSRDHWHFLVHSLVHLVACDIDGIFLHVDRKVGGILEAAVHLEDIIGRGEHHVTCSNGIREDHRLKHIDDLCDVSHLDAVGVALEDIERESSNHGIAHGVLLIEMAADRAGFLIPPGTPFVYEQTDMLVGIFLIHDSTVLLDDILYL